MKGNLTGDGTLGHAHISGIYGSGGDPIENTRDSFVFLPYDDNSEVMFRADSNAVYYVEASAIDRSAGRLGTYKLPSSRRPPTLSRAGQPATSLHESELQAP